MVEFIKMTYRENLEQQIQKRTEPKLLKEEDLFIWLC